MVSEDLIQRLVQQETWVSINRGTMPIWKIRALWIIRYDNQFVYPSRNILQLHVCGVNLQPYSNDHLLKCGASVHNILNKKAFNRAIPLI